MPADCELELKCRLEGVDGLIDVALARVQEIGSRAAAQRLLDAGAVTVDGARRPKRHRLSPGERVEVEIEERVAIDPGETGVPSTKGTLT